MALPPETDRLLFREWEDADLELFFAICSDPIVMQFVVDGDIWSLDRTRDMIETARALSRTDGYCRWPMIYKPNSQLIGFCGYIPSERGPEIGWRLAKDYWSRGLATEAARVVLRHGFQTLGFQRVVATVQAPNQPSIRVCEKLGMKFESSFQRRGREILVFGINRDEMN